VYSLRERPFLSFFFFSFVFFFVVFFPSFDWKKVVVWRLRKVLKANDDEEEEEG